MPVRKATSMENARFCAGSVRCRGPSAGPARCASPKARSQARAPESKLCVRAAGEGTNGAERKAGDNSG